MKADDDWGGTLKEGFVSVPNAFLDRLGTLDVTPGQFMLIMCILRYRFIPKDKTEEIRWPYPSITTLAAMMGVTNRTVQLRLRELRLKRMVKVVARVTSAGGPTSNVYDFGPLFGMLETAAKTPAPRRALPVDEASHTLQKRVPSEPSPPLPSEPSPEEDEHQKKTKDLASPTLPEPAAASPSRAGEPRLKLGSRVQNNPGGPLGEIIARKMAEASSKARKALPPPSQVASRRAAFEEKSPSQYNCNDMELVIRVGFAKRGWKGAPTFTGKDRSQAKQLIEAYSPDVVADVVQQTITRWEEVSAHFGANGFPSMAFVYGFRNSLFPYVLNGPQSKAKPGAGSQFNADDSREKGDEVGWGF